jgi:hypothetical protein
MHVVLKPPFITSRQCARQRKEVSHVCPLFARLEQSVSPCGRMQAGGPIWTVSGDGDNLISVLRESGMAECLALEAKGHACGRSFDLTAEVVFRTVLLCVVGARRRQGYAEPHNRGGML